MILQKYCDGEVKNSEKGSCGEKTEGRKKGKEEKEKDAIRL